MASEQDAIAVVLRSLRTRGLVAARRHRTIHNKLRPVMDRYTDVGDVVMANLHNADPHSHFEPRHVIWLAPPKRGGDAAALWYKWDFRPEGAIPMCKFYYGAWRMSWPHPRPLLPCDKVPQFLGYRFEPPETQGTKHGYYHSQPCQSMGEKGVPDPFAMDVVDTDPTWPLAADNATELLLCLVLALYGLDDFRRIRADLLADPAAQRNGLLRSGLERVHRLAKR